MTRRGPEFDADVWERDRDPVRSCCGGRFYELVGGDPRVTMAAIRENETRPVEARLCIAVLAANAVRR